ncbi:hypothetical protein HJG60_010356 [Phyllostomus discolor]|uniref:Uncharacterized protein n=1 Tax=Phyllostomus discolor TaxID=89673 RepID=A0A834AZ92_9CHIR|nr:hypothetical protein HJG60_010356 [Phyllostomus discolor]
MMTVQDSITEPCFCSRQSPRVPPSPHLLSENPSSVGAHVLGPRGGGGRPSSCLSRNKDGSASSRDWPGQQHVAQFRAVGRDAGVCGGFQPGVGFPKGRDHASSCHFKRQRGQESRSVNHHFCHLQPKPPPPWCTVSPVTVVLAALVCKSVLHGALVFTARTSLTDGSRTP